MRSGRRMQPAGKNITETRRAYAKLQRIHETESRFPRVVFEFDRNQRARVRLAQNALRYFPVARIINATDLRVLSEAFGQRARIFTMAVHAHRERLHAAQ